MLRLSGRPSHRVKRGCAALRRSCTAQRTVLETFRRPAREYGSTRGVRHVDAAGLTAKVFTQEFLKLPPAARQPCVIRGLQLGRVDSWTIESFRRDFGEAELWDKERLVTRRVNEFFDEEPTTGGGAPTEESYLFQFLGLECGPAPSAHVEGIRDSYTVPESVFGPDVWKLSTYAAAAISWLGCPLRVGRCVVG